MGSYSQVPSSPLAPQVSMSFLDGVDAPSTSAPCDLPGYEGLVFSRVKGFRLPVDDRKIRSWVYTQGHGYRLERECDGAHFWFCKICHKKKSQRKHWFKTDKATSSCNDHMEKQHSLKENGPSQRLKRLKMTDGSVQNGYDEKTKVQNEAAVEYDQFEFKTLLYDWIITDGISFHQVESVKLKALLAYLQPRCETHIPSHQTVGRTVGEIYDKVLGTVTETLHSAITKINISFDLWTSTNKLALLGLVAHFINDAGEPTTTLLSLPRQKGRHTGVNLAETVGDVIAEFHLEEKLGNFITDNASSNDTCLERLAHEGGYSQKERWIRCTGHVFNLVAQAILFGDGANAFEEDLVDKSSEEVKLIQWRKKGPIGKLHNIVFWINRSGYLSERFEQLQRVFIAPTRPDGKAETYELVRDVETRWNSFDDSVERALYLRPAIDELMLEVKMEHERKKKTLPILADQLTDDDWNVLAMYHEILEPVKTATGLLQGEAGGRYGCIWQVLPTFERLLEHFEQLRLQYPVRKPTMETVQKQHQQSPMSFNEHHSFTADAVSSMSNEFATFETHLSTNINLGWQKLNDYYDKLGDTSIYVAAVVLHPRMKWRWIEKHWVDAERSSRDSWIEPARMAFTKRSLEYESKELARRGGESLTLATSGSGLKRKRKSKAAEWFDDELSEDGQDEQPRMKTIEQQIAEYNAEPRHRTIKIEASPVPYWLEQRDRWPDLSAMALDIYATPAMSDAPERIFSETGAAVGPRRRLLHSETIKWLMCVKSWVRSGVVKFDRYVIQA